MFSKQIQAASSAIAGFGQEYLDTYAEGEMKMSLVRVEQMVSAFVAEIDEMNYQSAYSMFSDMEEYGLVEFGYMNQFCKYIAKRFNIPEHDNSPTGFQIMNEVDCSNMSEDDKLEMAYQLSMNDE